ncbi:hypothetical protein BDZ89DRAFT_1076641 [Hymenopellis radicata]|nr:hypothetical protein BDZ89DRAFT_1076641 [Hymenopellis radicata]
MANLASTNISPVKPRYTSLTSAPVATLLEETLQEALRDAEARMQHWKARCTQLQSQVVLQECYVKRKEAKKNQGKNRRLNSDGKGKLLTKDEFYQLVVDHDEEARREEEAKEARRMEKETRLADLARDMRKWEAGEEERKQRNDALQAEWKEDVKEWEIERDLAKSEKRRARWKKPVKPKLEKAAPKPKAPSRRRAGPVPDEGDVEAEEEEGARRAVWAPVNPESDSDWMSDEDDEILTDLLWELAFEEGIVGIVWSGNLPDTTWYPPSMSGRHETWRIG